MKTTTKSKRRIPVLLSILCAGLVTAFLGGCAEGPYVTAYDGGYYPAGYYTRILVLRPLRVFLLRTGLRYYGRALGRSLQRCLWSALLSHQDCLRRLVLICDARLANASVHRHKIGGCADAFIFCLRL